MSDELETKRRVAHSHGFGHICFLLLSLQALFPILGHASDPTAYDHTKDPFYKMKRINATWIMIWNGSTEKGWWNESDYHGCKVKVDGVWQSINWNNDNHIDTYCKAIRDAGINAILIDFTNGFRWERQAKRVQNFCHDNGIKIAIAFNSEGGKTMEQGCKTIWDVYASPESPLGSSYLYKDGKPLAVLYTTRQGYEASVALTGPCRSRFTTVWTSGEDSDEDKWGWQLEPHVGPVPSKDSMFVTGSIKFGSPRTTDDEWRKNLAWLDYGFVMARRHAPKHLIVGSFDDVHERNAWIVADTEKAPKGWQMRGKDGAHNRDAYYARVTEWLKSSPSVVKGGVIPDGAYVVKASNGKALGTKKNRLVGEAVLLAAYGESVENLVWFYHLGDDVYRMIKLNAAFPIGVSASKVVLQWDCEAATQRWALEKVDRGFRILNKDSRDALTFLGTKVMTEARDDASPNQYWSLVKQAAVLESQDICEQGAEGDAANRAP